MRRLTAVLLVAVVTLTAGCLGPIRVNRQDEELGLVVMLRDGVPACVAAGFRTALIVYRGSGPWVLELLYAPPADDAGPCP